MDKVRLNQFGGEQESEQESGQDSERTTEVPPTPQPQPQPQPKTHPMQEAIDRLPPKDQQGAAQFVGLVQESVKRFAKKNHLPLPKAAEQINALAMEIGDVIKRKSKGSVMVAEAAAMFAVCLGTQIGYSVHSGKPEPTEEMLTELAYIFKNGIRLSIMETKQANKPKLVLPH